MIDNLQADGKITMISICPRCKRDSGVIVNVRASGPAKMLFEEMNTPHIEIFHAGLHFNSTSKTVRCATCGKIRRDLRFNKNERIVELM